MRLIPDTRGGMLWRFALGAVIVIAFTATATAVAGLLTFKQLATDIGVTPAIKNAQVTIADPGNPQTLLLIGSDHRAGTPFRQANTDTMMLVRLDPSSSTINVLSIPRDLKVQIPEAAGYITDKINATYSIGGPNLLIKVLREQVFPGLRVNHIIDVNFGGFSALVNAIGCVYSDVDHRYYNNTIYTGYSSIDIRPGYQKLCGDDALAFVRFRHTDTDIVREARQQDFLRWAKSQYSGAQLVTNRDTLLRIFGAHTETDHDLHTVDGLINLFNLVAFSAGHTIKQIPFPAVLQPCGPLGAARPGAPAPAVTPCFVTSDPVSEQRVFRALMAPTTAAAPASKASPAPHGSHRPRRASTSGLVADAADGRGQAAALGPIGMPVYYPSMLVQGSSYCSNTTGNCTPGDEPPVEYLGEYPRKYVIHGQHGGSFPAYRMTLVKNPLLGQYYGVQGTTWKNPPLLNSPTRIETVGGKQLMEFFNGHKLSVVAWRTSFGTYWISNTLTDDIPNQQLIGIAASLTRAGS